MFCILSRRNDITMKKISNLIITCLFLFHNFSVHATTSRLPWEITFSDDKKLTFNFISKSDANIRLNFTLNTIYDRIEEYDETKDPTEGDFKGYPPILVDGRYCTLPKNSTTSKTTDLGSIYEVHHLISQSLCNDQKIDVNNIPSIMLRKDLHAMTGSHPNSKKPDYLKEEKKKYKEAVDTFADPLEKCLEFGISDLIEVLKSTGLQIKTEHFKHAKVQLERYSKKVKTTEISTPPPSTPKKRRQPDYHVCPEKPTPKSKPRAKNTDIKEECLNIIYERISNAINNKLDHTDYFVNFINSPDIDDSYRRNNPNGIILFNPEQITNKTSISSLPSPDEFTDITAYCVKCKKFVESSKNLTDIKKEKLNQMITDMQDNLNKLSISTDSGTSIINPSEMSKSPTKGTQRSPQKNPVTPTKRPHYNKTLSSPLKRRNFASSPSLKQEYPTTPLKVKPGQRSTISVN